MDQWNRKESPEINSYIYNQLVFDKGGKNIEDSLFLANGVGKSMKLEYTLLPYTKMNSKWLQDLNIRQDTRQDIIKLLEVIIRKTFSDKS